MKTKIWNLMPEWFKKMPHADKVAHAIIGLLIFAFFTWVFTFRPQLVGWSEKTLFALLITTGVAWVNERLDQKKGGTGSFWDIAATVLVPFFVTLAMHIMEAK